MYFYLLGLYYLRRRLLCRIAISIGLRFGFAHHWHLLGVLCQPVQRWFAQRENIYAYDVVVVFSVRLTTDNAQYTPPTQTRRNCRVESRRRRRYVFGLI